jgi:hypothetical protein
MKTLRIAGFALGLTVVAFPSHAEPENEATLICAATHTVECDGYDEECHQGQSDAINFPRFFRVDFRKMEIHILDHERKGEVTEVMHVARSESRGWIILQGVEEGRPWSMLITEQTGRFSLVINEDDAAFNVFGACTSP